MVGPSAEPNDRGEMASRAIARQLSDIVDTYNERCAGLFRNPQPDTFMADFKAAEAVYNECLIQLRDRFGGDLVLDALLSNRAADKQPPFEVAISRDRFMEHFREPSNRNFGELYRVCCMFESDELCLELLKEDARSWSALGHYHELRNIIGLLANNCAQQPLVFAEILRNGCAILELAHREYEAAGEIAGVVINHDLLLGILREHSELSLATLSYLLRRPWLNGAEKPVEALSTLVRKVASVGRHGVQELFRDCLEPSVPLEERRGIANFLVGAGKGVEIILGATLDPLLRSANTLADHDFEYLTSHFRTVCSGLADPDSYMGCILLDRGAHFLTGGEPVDFISALRQRREEFPSIPERLLLLAVGQLDGDREMITKFDHVCEMILQWDEETKCVAWEYLRVGLNSFGHYKESRIARMLEVGGINSREDALSFSQYMRESATLATIATRHGQSFPEMTSNWSDNLASLADVQLHLWSAAIAAAFPSTVKDYLAPRDESRGEFETESHSSSARSLNKRFHISSHEHLLPFFQYAYTHWEAASVEHARETELFIQALGAPPYEGFKRHRYDETRESVAEQLRSLNRLQRESWREDYLGKPVRSVEKKVASTRRLLVTDFSPLLIQIGDTPKGTESCLSLSSNPRYNKALLALLEDAHQKVALFVDVDRLPEELRSAQSITPDLLFRYSSEIRDACICRSILKIGEKYDRSPVLIQAPEYFSRRRRDKRAAREFRRELGSYAVAQLAVPLFAGIAQDGSGEVLSIPPSNITAGQNDDYDGVNWSSCVRGRYYIKLRLVEPGPTSSDHAPEAAR